MMFMEKILLDSKAKLKLETLCDAKHPEEVGGYLLGYKYLEDTIIRDIFPVPNVEEGNKKYRTYREHSWGGYWCNLYASSIGLYKQGKFHSHPNGTIPSVRDIDACSDLWIWVIHHKMGQHTFIAARNSQNREIVYLKQPEEAIFTPHFVGEKFYLGIPIVNFLGKIELDEQSKKNNETKR